MRARRRRTLPICHEAHAAGTAGPRYGNRIVDRKKLRLAVGSRAKAAAVPVVVVVALIAAFTLTNRDFGMGFSAHRKEAAAIALDATIGATVEPLDRATAESLGIPPRHKGLVITSLGSNSPAARAGIRTGDVIERIGGAPVGSVGDAVAALKGVPAPDLILLLNRHGEYVIVRLPTPDLAIQGGER